MDSKLPIPGLGQFSPEAHRPVQAAEPPSAAAAVETTPDTDMTGADIIPPEVGTRADDKIESGVQHEATTVSAKTTAASTEPNAVAVETLPSDASSRKDDGEDTKMDDGQSQEKTGITVEQSATAVAEIRDTEMDGIGTQEQEATRVESQPASPPITHALEAALDGLLGPVDQRAVKESSPINGEPVVQQEPSDPTPADHAPTSGVLPAEDEADANPEWEADSSPYESSSSDSSDDSSDDDSDVEESKLGIEETARLLMEADGGSDEEIDGARAAKQAAGVRTKNEQPDEPEPKPEITIAAEDVVLPLGIVQHIVEGTLVVIEALRDGNAVTILDRGTVLCKEDRTVLGVIHDTIATVHKPMYILKCRTEEELKTAGLERGTQIWYAKSHAVFVFPSQLEKEKGSDASNLYDEEVGPEEVEYSDDEQEQAHKREKKNKKQRAKGNRGNKSNRGDDHELRASTNGDPSLRYDEDDDGPYKPLSRPANFGMGLPTAPPPPVAMSAYPPANGSRGGHQQGRRGDSRGRGGRGRGFNGRGRGGHGHSSPHSTPQPQNSYLPPPPFTAAAPAVPGQWPYPVPPIPHFGGAAPSNSSSPPPNYPMPNWGAAQPSPFAFPPVPPPNWPNTAQRPPQQASYQPPTGGYHMPALPYPSNGPANAPVPPPNYQQQYQNYYGNGQAPASQVPNGQSQQRWG
ncbi:hypothetical protein N0V82_008279 [Gnomoniopsis sp. IMI 355080]|nr:hypothetical protein N0V82_008279 [Gnomoniopsis sp. IMI 355080]